MFGYQEFIKGNQHRRIAKAQRRRAHSLEKNKTRIAAGMGLATGATSALAAHKLIERHARTTGKTPSKLHKAAIIGGAALVGGATGAAAGHYGTAALVHQQREAAKKQRQLAKKAYLKGSAKLALHTGVGIAAAHALAPGAVAALGAKGVALGKSAAWGAGALAKHGLAHLGIHGGTNLLHWGAAHAVPAAKAGAIVGAGYLANKKINKM